MDIIGMEDRKDRDRIIVRAVMNREEFERLQGRLDDLVVFSPDTINVSASAIKTGARHNHSKYLLLPVKVRRDIKMNPLFEVIQCGLIYGPLGKYVVYRYDNI